MTEKAETHAWVTKYEDKMEIHKGIYWLPKANFKRWIFILFLISVMTETVRKSACRAEQGMSRWVMGQMGHENRMGHMGHGYPRQPLCLFDSLCISRTHNKNTITHKKSRTTHKWTFVVHNTEAQNTAISSRLSLPRYCTTQQRGLQYHAAICASFANVNRNLHTYNNTL